MELNQNEIANETENVSKEGDEILTTELDEEECVRTKKKSRRVSFADITSVHVFDRDEDFETPPDSKPNAGGNTIKTPPIGSSDSQPKELQHKDIDQHLQVTPTSSLQKEEFKVSDAQAATPVSVSDKGSPGEDREFFGPVSLWHIAPGMSVCSPVEDDITLDCTTFSLQFGKLMNPDKQCSNLAEVVKTPASETGVSVLVTEDFETPVEQSEQPSSENTMALTQPKQAKWWMVSNGKTLDNCEGMNAMCSSQEKQIKYEYESMSPYLELMLAEKLSEVQPGVSFEEHNQEKEHLRSSCSHTDSAFRKTGQGMKSQDSAGVKIKTSIMESEEYTKQGSAILTMDQLTIENMPNNPNKGTGLTTAANSFVFDFDMGNLQQQEQSLMPQWKFEPNNLVDKEMDGCFIDIIATECSKNTKMMLDAKIKQSIIETGGTEQHKTTEVMEGENCPLIKFETEQQEKQTRKLSDSEIGMEPKKYADLEMHGSTTGIMATKPCNGTGYMITLEGNQSMTVTANLERENSSSLLNSETDHSQEKVKEIAALNLSRRTGLKDASDAEGETCNIDIRTTENNAIDCGHSTAEIAAPITKEDTHLRLLDDSHFEKSEEQHLDNSQEEERRLLLNLAQNIEVKDPVKNELETSAIDVMENKQNIHTKLASHGEMKQTLEIMVVMPNKDDPCTFSDCLPFLNCNGKDQMQQLLWKSEMKMDPQRPLNLEKDISTIPVSTAQNNKTNVTDKKETDHPMGITAANDKKDAIFVQDREKNQSLAELHKQVKLALPQCTTHFNPEEEHHQQKQEESSISSKVFEIHGKSKLSEDQLNGNSKEAGSILKPIEMNITMPSNKQELKSFGSIEDTVLLDRCASLNNEYLEGYVKHCPEQDRGEEKGTVICNDLSSDFPVSNTDIQQVCEHVDSAQTELSSSVMSHPQIKYFIPRSELSLSKCNAVSDSSVTPLKKQSELENAHKYPFISDENLEDSDLKDMQVSLPFPASVSKSLFRPLDSIDCHEIPNNASSEHLSGLNCDGKDQMQQLLWNSELKMDPHRPLNLEKEISTVSVPTAQKNETNVTGKKETDHPMGITAANDKNDAIFVQDREKNQSIAQLHNQVMLAPPQRTTHFNPEEEHHQQKQEQMSSSSQDFKLHGKSKLSEDQLIDKLSEAGSILKPIETNITMHSNKQELGSIEETVLLDKCVSLNNEYLEGYGKHIPEPDIAEERKGTVIGNDLCSIFPVSNRDIRQVCQHVDSTQIEVSSIMSQPNIKHSFPRSELSISKCNAVSDSSVTPLKQQSQLETAHKYPFISDENLEDSDSKDIEDTDSKDIQASLPFPASVSKSLFRPMNSKECHKIPNYASSDPKESSESRVKVNSRLSCQNIDPNLSVSGIDQCISILSKNKYSKDLNNIRINTPLNNKTGLVSDCSMSTQLISTDKKSKIVCEPFDLKPNLPSVHKDASFFGNRHHGLFSNSESVLSPSVLPILSPIRGTMCEMTPLGPIADCGSLPNVKKSNYSSVIRNDAKGCSTSNIFSTPLNLSNCGDANYGYSHLDSIEHLNMPGGSNQIDLESSFQEPVRDTHNANPVSDGHTLITSFMDTCASNRNLMNSDFCSVSHLKGNIQGEIHKEFFLQKKPDFLNCENCKDIEPRDAGIIFRNAVDSDHQLTSAVKLNTERSSTKSNNGEQASCMGTQNVKMNSNCGNVSLPLSEKKCSLIQQGELHWKSFAETQHPNYTSGYISEGPMALQHASGNGSLKTFELACATEKTLSSQALNDRGYLNKKRKCEEMDVQDQGSLIKDHKNTSLSYGIESVDRKLSEKVIFESSEGRMPSTKRPFVMGTEPTEDVINVSDEICQEVEELQIPLIRKPKTQEECLCFIFSSQPQLCLFQETLKLIQEDIDRMKISSNPQFQALDVKKCSQMENKFLRKSQSWGSLKWLQQVVAYEKSKLLLLQAKKQELMKNVQELHRGCQELDQLKSHYLQMTGRFRGSAKAHISRAEKEAHIHFLEAEIRKQVETLSNKRMIMQGSLHKIEGENRKASERVLVMKRELEVLGDKIRDICNFYCGVLRLKDYKNKEDITKMLKIHVEKRSLATLILKDIQHWIVKDIKYKPGYRFIELAYSDILYQRFVIEGDGPDANVFASNRLDKQIVEKVFPLSNAIEAFGFVLDLKQSLKIGGLGSICQVVAETRFLYCTLVDVLEEVQTCRMRLQNLSFTQFVHTSGEELHLQLIFIDCRMGLKARVMLDMSNLRCAVYPSDILPCQIDIELFGRQPQELLILEELHELTRALKPGYSRIKDLCGCISKVIGSKR